MGTEADGESALRGFRPSGRADIDLAALATSQDGIVEDAQHEPQTVVLMLVAALAD